MAELTRRDLIARTSLLGLGALVAAGCATAEASAPMSGTGLTAGSGATLAPSDATLQAFADTIIPGRPASRTESGAPIDPLAIAGVDPQPGAVEADTLALYQNAEVGFDALAPAFLGELDARSVAAGGSDFLHLPFATRVQVCLAGLDYSNSTVLVWEAAAAVPFTAFCAAALVPAQTAAAAVGYAVMGLPGVAPGGYASFSFRRRLARERTSQGSLP